mmetsp:Transcript_29165/g.81580  ORF Transcript_29165/g.81580 Transcript_29165/m.81580 type:complete len:303 (-) Transcript_29165:1038-1946(-)
MESKANASKAIMSMSFGGIAGAAAKTVTSPLERVRILAQTGESKQGMVRTMFVIYRTEGAKGFWRGNGTNILRIFPHKGILFMCNDTYKELIATLSGAESHAHLSTSMYFAAGSMSGITATFVTYPLDVVRTRLSGKYAAEGRANSIIGIARMTVAREGVRGMYKGMFPTLLGAVPYEGVKFGMFDVCKKAISPWVGGIMESDRFTDKNQKVVVHLLAGAMAASISGFIIYPNDTTRRMLQLDGEGGKAKRFRGLLDCYKYIYRKEGLRRFYRGILPYTIRMVPNAAIQFAVYEYLKLAAGF